MSQRLRDARTVLVSACLLGEACRYDGKGCLSASVLRAIEGKEVVPVCPEAGAGLGTPRPAVELSGGDGDAVLDGRARARVKEGGADRTAQLLEGARLATAAAALHRATAALLKEHSPSCGARWVWVEGRLEAGSGVAAAALRRSGVAVVSDEELQPQHELCAGQRCGDLKPGRVDERGRTRYYGLRERPWPNDR